MQKSLKEQKLKFSGSAKFYMKTRLSLKYFVNDCLWKHFFDSNSPQNPSKLISLTLLGTLRPFTQFCPKVRANKLQKSVKTCLTW